MTSVLRSLLNTMGVPPRTVQTLRAGCPAPGRRCRIYRRISILTQDDDRMQKPVVPRFGDGDNGPAGLDQPAKNGDSPRFLRKEAAVTIFGVVGTEGVAMSGSASPVGGQADRGHLPQ